MNDTKIEIQITVSRTAGGRKMTACATVTAERETKGLNPGWLADKLGTSALRKLDRDYNVVSKVFGEVPEAPSDTSLTP